MPHYKWDLAGSPPPLQRHSEVKHTLLRNYLVDYFLTLVPMPQQDKIQLTIVDGFCGGGLYQNESSQEVPGSPIVILEAIQEAQAQLMIQQDRRKPIDIDVELICIDESQNALDYLRYVLHQKGYERSLAEDKIRLIKGKFTDHCSTAIKRAEDRSPKSGRVLFVLDQYGYSAVPLHCLHEIFSKLKHAEVILTFYIDALLTYLDRTNLNNFERKTGLSTAIQASDLDATNRSPRWRGRLQSLLYQRLASQSSARFHTPFFIRPERGHGDFWLLHLSQHWKARDVMANTHWSHHNHFAHYGQAGFDMFSTGYIGKLDDGNKLQMGFDFSDVAAEVSKSTMMAQIPRLLFDRAEGITFEQFFLKLINTTPATQKMVQKTILDLHQLGEILVVDERGDTSRARVQLKGGHILKLPSQRSFLF
ncbi:three-Cys-motif partner protein TcmP [Eoetvoesiella caeni]